MKWIKETLQFKSFIVLLIVFMLSGCVSIKYDPASGTVHYSRLGDQELGGVEIVLPDGSYVVFERQKSEGRALYDTLALVERLINRKVIPD